MISTRTNPPHADSGWLAERPRCVEHGLLLSPDGACTRCERAVARNANRRVAALVVAGAAALLLVLAIVRAAAMIDALAPSTATAHAETAATRGQLVVYTTASCPHCRRAKAWLDAEGVAYTERAIDSDPSAAADLRARGGRLVVPTFVIDDDIQPGLDAQAVLLARLVDKHGLRAPR